MRGTERRQIPKRKEVEEKEKESRNPLLLSLSLSLALCYLGEILLVRGKRRNKGSESAL